MPSESTRLIDELAIFGGVPRFSTELHVGRPNVGNREKLHARIDELLDRHWLTNDGPFVREFEQRIAELTGVRNCVAVSSGTAALEIAFRSLGLTGEVIVPSFTFVATVHSLAWQGLTPVFCDIRPGSFHLDPERLEELVTPQTSAILGVHTWGVPCDVDTITAFADERNLKVVLDAAHAFGCSLDGRPIGGFGDVEIFSFHGTKFVNSFEGGCLVTNDDEIARQARLLRNFGFEWYDRVVSTGTNAKLDEARAAMGLTSLEAIEQFVTRNRDNYRTYRAGLSDVPGVTVYELPDDGSVNYQYVVTLIDEDQAGLARDQLVDLLTAENVRARRYFYPGCHRMEPYRTLDPDAGLRLPVTEQQAARVMLLPTGTQLGSSGVRRICDLIRFVVSNSDEIAARLDETWSDDEQ